MQIINCGDHVRAELDGRDVDAALGREDHAYGVDDGTCDPDHYDENNDYTQMAEYAVHKWLAAQAVKHEWTGVDGDVDFLGGGAGQRVEHKNRPPHKFESVDQLDVDEPTRAGMFVRRNRTGTADYYVLTTTPKREPVVYICGVISTGNLLHFGKPRFSHLWLVEHDAFDGPERLLEVLEQ